MSGALVTLKQVTDDSIRYLERLLEDNDLPTRDVRAKSECFYVGYDDDRPIGAGGVEVHGSHGLLRSIVVEQDLRGEGLGTGLCRALERRARKQGLESLYLLTTTAPEFFEDRGFEEVERTDAPGDIRGTTQFDHLCPESATCMRKSL